MPSQRHGDTSLNKPLMRLIGRRIRYLRRELHNQSARDLAEELGLSREAVAQWEGGYVMPKIANLIRIACYYEVDADWLLGREFWQSSSAQLALVSEAQICRMPRRRSSRPRFTATANIGIL